MDVDNTGGPSAGDIYVTDGYGYRVLKFGPAGNFILMFGDGVDQTTGGDVCTAASGDTCKVGTSGGAAEQFRNPRYLAVDQSSGPSAGDVYVADSEQHKVHKYDENGNLITTWGTGGVINGSGVEGGPFGYMQGIDVTSSGQLLVNACEPCTEPRIFKFAQDGTSEGSILIPPLQSESFAWSPQGYFFKVGSGPRIRRARAADGSELLNVSKVISSGYPRTLNVDSSTGTAYAVVETSPPRVYEYRFNGSGQPLDSEGNPCPTTLTETGEGCDPTHIFGSDALEGSGGIGIDSASNRVYVADGRARAIDAFVGAPAPIAQTEEPTWRATVHGTAKPDEAGEIVECFFEFGATRAYGSKQPCEPGPGYAADQAVSAELAGVNGDGQHTYHYRLVLNNANGAMGFGTDKTFIPSNVKALQTLQAENITRTAATLKGSFEETGQETKYYFEWGKTTAYGNTSAAPPGETAESPTLSYVAGSDGAKSYLQPETTYHYRVVAENALYGVTYGQDMTFTTLPAVENLTTEAATPVERRSATLKGSFQGDGNPTSWRFEWGKTTSYGNSTTIEGPESPTVIKHVSVQLTGLELETTYHYRIVATNEAFESTTDGNDQSFTTLPAVSGLITKAATSIDQESVTLNGEFTGNGEDTNYYFEYGLTTEYGMVSQVPPGPKVEPTPGPSVTEALQSEITDFEAYETYHYRLVASNAVGVTYGNDQTFTAPAAPLPGISGTTASNISPTGATLEAEINPNRWMTVYSFEYGRTPSYGSSTEISSSIGAGTTTQPVSAVVSDLSPGTLYHFRVVAINYTGTAYGPDETLFTPAPPRIDLTFSSGVGETDAQIGARVNPNGAVTTVHFEYGTSTAYGQSTADVPAGSDGAAHEVGAGLTGLAAGTTYHFRVVASNAFGTISGSDQSFTTLPATVVKPPEERHRPKCRKGFVRRHGKCVKRRRGHRKHRHSTRRHG